MSPALAETIEASFDGFGIRTYLSEGEVKMSSQRIPLRIGKGPLIRDEASRLGRYGANIDNYQARAALKTIKEDCDHLRQYLGLLTERTNHTELSSSVPVAKEKWVKPLRKAAYEESDAQGYRLDPTRLLHHLR